MSDIAEALRQFPWRTDSQQHLAMRAAAHISQLEADFAEASKERSHQHGRADRNAREYANAQKTCEELRARIERLEAALRPFACKCSVKGEGAGGNCTRGSGERDCWNARVALEATPASLMAAPVWDAAEPARAALGERT